MARKNSRKPIDINEISYEYEVEENSLDDVIIGTPVASFSFGSNAKEDNIENPGGFISFGAVAPVTKGEIQSIQSFSQVTTQEIEKFSNKLIDNRVGKPTANGITPPIDGESFDIKRTYALRKSTVRKLNELKAAHPDVNAYLSTILDEAITYYHNHIFNGNLK